MKHVTIMNVPFLHTDQRSFVSLLNERIKENSKTFVITANPEIVMKANQDATFMTYINQATYITADGIGIVKAAQLLKNPLPGRVTGYDTMVALLEIANEKNYSIYLLGASAETLQKAEENIHKDYPNVRIIGSNDGYFDWDNNTVAEEIQTSKPDMVFVALGVPRQEKWISEHIDQFDTGVFIGVGGSIDVIAGTVQRAPEFWQKLNLEWFYRLMKQPSRIGRMMVLPHFALKVIGLKIKGETAA